MYLFISSLFTDKPNITSLYVVVCTIVKYSRIYEKVEDIEKNSLENLNTCNFENQWNFDQIWPTFQSNWTHFLIKRLKFNVSYIFLLFYFVTLKIFIDLCFKCIEFLVKNATFGIQRCTGVLNRILLLLFFHAD